MQMPDCLPGLKPEATTGPARPSTSVLSQLVPNDTTQVPKNTTAVSELYASPTDGTTE
jgi:hypothetical protein